MIDLLFVGDGPRDHVMVPYLVQRVLGVTIRPTTTHWARLHREGAGSGYRRKLRFAMLQAQDARAKGMVLTVDTDTDRRRQKFKELRKVRDEERAAAPPFPTALGEADPHGEVWLLDDRVAVGSVLGVKDGDIPNVRKTPSPKDTLEELRQGGSHAETPILEVLEAIARRVDPSRCDHKKETGLHALLEEVRRELGPLVAQCGTDCPCGDACDQVGEKSAT
jgi:hypothetical protein